MTGNPPITLVRPEVSHDTIEALEFLLYEARRGELVGLAYGAMLRQRACIVDTAGDLHNNPVLSLGVVCMLSNDIADRAREQRE